MERISAALFGVATLIATPASAQVSPDALRSTARGGTLEVGYHVAKGATTDGFAASDPELAVWALQAWARAIGPAVRLVPDAEDKALIRVVWAGPLGGQYGEMRPLAVDGRSGAAVYIRSDMRALGDDIERLTDRDPLLRDSIVYLTCLHEIGHALGLPHTADFSDIMYSFGYGGDIVKYFGRYRAQLRSRDDISRVSGLSRADARVVRDRFDSPSPR